MVVLVVCALRLWESSNVVLWRDNPGIITSTAAPVVVLQQAIRSWLRTLY